MIVITLSDCPPKVRGDLSKWLCEISPGVYVGNLNARVRTELWARVCENLKSGRATMVYSARCEQQMKFEVHNALWEPVDLEGVRLMRRPLPASQKASNGSAGAPQSLAGKMLLARRAEKKHRSDEYVVIDVETTGVSTETDGIIEIGALLVKNGEAAEEFQVLVQRGSPLNSNIVSLTGITDEMLKAEGVPPEEALTRLVAFVANRTIVCHNADFDCGFLLAEAKRCGVKLFRSQCKDTLTIARRRVKGVTQYSLGHLCEHFGIDVGERHRALSDCKLTFRLFEKLNEI